MIKKKVLYAVAMLVMSLAVVGSEIYEIEASTSSPFWERRSGKLFYNNGNVGIGTSGPLDRLTVHEPSKNLDIGNNNSMTGSGIVLNARNDANNAHISMELQAEKFYFHHGKVYSGAVGRNFQTTWIQERQLI